MSLSDVLCITQRTAEAENVLHLAYKVLISQSNNYCYNPNLACLKKLNTEKWFSLLSRVILMSCGV